MESYHVIRTFFFNNLSLHVFPEINTLALDRFLIFLKNRIIQFGNCFLVYHTFFFYLVALVYYFASHSYTICHAHLSGLQLWYQNRRLFTYMCVSSLETSKMSLSTPISCTSPHFCTFILNFFPNKLYYYFYYKKFL
jgi:hypothetical protein